MIKFIKNYFKMKAQEIQLKLTFYAYFNALIASQKDIINLFISLFNKLKDLSPEELNPEELKKEIIVAIAEVVHDSNENQGE